MEYFFFFVVVIVFAFIWGYATDSVIKNKGYTESWFWIGFIFGIIGFLVALSKPEVRSDYTVTSYVNSNSALHAAAELTSKERLQRSENKTLSQGGWRCTACKKVNPSYTGTCSCGMRKSQSNTIQADMKKKEEQKEKTKTEIDNLQLLKSYKDLLDSGVISQEEFDKKKSELLKL